jgi:septation ring formation regulator EzrA
MTTWISLILAFLSVLLIPLIVIAFRGAMKWSRMESKLDNVVTSLQDIVKDKDKVHAELTYQMREDRKATNERLTWLERNVWKGNKDALQSGKER